MVEYLPVTLSVDHPYPELEAWVASRFAALNKKQVMVVGRADLPPEALIGHPTYAKAWLWDIVPANVDRILFFDFDIIPLRAMPLLPDAPFIAVPDAQWYIDRMRAMYPFFAATRYVFNAGFFVAHRDTRKCFDQLKSFTVKLGFNSPYGSTYEQTPFNHLIQSSFDVHWLPRTVHCLAHTNYDEAPTACLLHLTGAQLKARWAIMEMMRAALGTAAIEDVHKT